uniref:C2H2-type domain-containing protein n=1 Tax=Anopheles epiroticus TaxID=199890 RepID=A0A182P0B4_9DIPT
MGVVREAKAQDRSGIKYIYYEGKELSIFPINLEKKDRTTGEANSINGADAAAQESDEEIEFILPKDYCAKLSAQRPEESDSRSSELAPLLSELKQNGQLQELAIIERRRSLDVLVVNSIPTGIESPKPEETDNEPNDLRVRPNGVDSSRPCSNKVVTFELENRTDHINMLSKGPLSAKPARSAIAIQKRRTRRTITPNDPAKPLTEMSVRGLNLFQYATLTGGMYQCVECTKDGLEKTFKNKYSFQRHAFLFHEGKQRKVFPCPVCVKQFSRPDKMKSHLRLIHETFHGKAECASPSAAA